MYVYISAFPSVTFALPDMLSANPTLFKPIPFFMLQKDNLDKSFNLQLTPPACSRAFVRVFIRVCKFARACAYSNLWHTYLCLCVNMFACPNLNVGMAL